ncbi:transfer protein [Streptomyces sp. NPDC001530]|uniref:transfer protein n=1 Tax=Streptomyces sp. NPDC001530 TaxID=3364582 RepID=UPI0036A49831
MGQIVELEVATPYGGLGRYDHLALCAALRVDDPSRVVVEQDGMSRAMVTVYPSNPLASTPVPTDRDLMMDRKGRIIIGRYHNGRPVYLRLYDMLTGSAQRIALFGTTGAGKSRSLQLILAALKRNGAVTWLADLKSGQSVPEAKGQVDWHATTQEEAIHMLRAAVAVAEERMRRYAAMGRTAFLKDDPDPLLFVWIDEANRLLEKGAPYREEATALVKELGRTGRSVGVGVGLAAQASHLEEMGGSDTLRGMLKEGEVILLRWSSGMMRQLVSDGLLPTGETLQPIPKYLGVRTLRSRLDLGDDDDDRPGTQGMAYHLTGEHPTAMLRFSRVGSIAPAPGLDPEIVELYGNGSVPGVEAASVDMAGEQYAVRGTGVILPLFDEEDGDGTSTRAPSGAVSPGRSLRLPDRILRALQDGPLDTYGVLEALKADGGKAVKPGSVRNALGDLKADGLITSDGGTHTLTE